LFSGLILGLLILSLFPEVSLAIGNPTSVTIGDVYVFRDVFIEDDQLYFCRYDVSYDPMPDEDPWDTWQMALYASNGTLIATRPLNYYQHNIISIYLTDEQAITWEGAHQVKIEGMPSVFGTLTEGVNMRTRTLSPGDYYEKSFLAGVMITQAGILEDDWVITLLTSDDKLNTTGSAFFLEAVPGLNAMEPDIFEITSSSINPNYQSYNNTYREELKNNAGSQVDFIITEFTQILPTSKNWMSFWLVIFGFVIMAGVIFSRMGNPAWGFIGGFPFIVGGAYLLGGEIFTFAAVCVIVAAVIFGLYFILSRFA